MAPTLLTTSLPPSKRLRVSPEEDPEETEIQPHPLRIKPSGNAFTSPTNLRDISTGRFARFPDELILQILGYLDVDDLNAAAATSKGMYGFSHAEELWKALFIESPAHSSTFTWRGTWRRTLLRLPAEHEVQIPLPTLFSDALYRPHHMSQIPLAPFTTQIPPRNQILRLSALTAADFESTYSNLPFILTTPVKSWRAYNKWTPSTLAAHYGATRFRAEAVDWQLDDYISYMGSQADESPLYLFDRRFSETTSLTADFTPPPCFGTDYFSILNDSRPDHRWLILGPARSGSSFHKDPNATSAWNAVLTGEKYWLLFPPHVVPPGVFVSADESEVTSPLSIAEWLVGFHAEARRTAGCVEGVCAAGEMVYVPSGWWHLVVNTSSSLALTQNFVPRPRIPEVLEFLDRQRISVSGFECGVKDPYALFVARMGEEFPAELEEAAAALEKRRKGKRKSRWEELVGEKKKKEEESSEGGSGGGGFLFGFGGEDSDDGE